MQSGKAEAGAAGALSLPDDLQRLFADTAELFALVEPDGTLRYCNHTGFVAGARIGDELFPHWPESSRAIVQQLHVRVLATGQPARSDVLTQDAGGAPCWLHLIVNPVRSAESRISSLLYIGVDIGVRHKEEERLRRVEGLMIDTEGISHCGVWEWDITQPHATWTPGLYRIYGLDPATYVPSYEEYLKRVHPDDRQRVMNATEGVFQRHIPYSHDERIFHSDGSIRYLHTWAVPVLAPDGKLLRLMGVCMDVTERKLAEIALADKITELNQLNHNLEARVAERTAELSAAKNVAEAASASKSLFLARMSHEVRTPMNGVLGMIELLMEGNLSTDQRRMLGTVRDSADTLLGILDDILDFSKIEAGHMLLESIPINIRRVLEGVADTLLANAQRKGLRLHCHVDTALPAWVLGDQVRLRQILLNFGSNAIKFTQTTPEKSGEVRISAMRFATGNDRVGLLLSVSDNGIGMDAAARERLFLPFTQADVSTTRQFGGTGLGLSICRQLTELMDGEISVESAPGAGATFEVRLQLPVADGPPEFDAALTHGLQVIALVHPGETQRVLAAYLAAAGATVDAHPDLPGFHAALEKHDWRKPTVLLVGPEYPEQVVAEWLPGLKKTYGHPELKTVLLVPRRESSPDIAAPDIVRVGAWPLRTGELLTGIAVAAGRVMSDETPSPVMEQPAVDVVADESQLILMAEDNPINQEITRRQIEHLGYRCVVAENGRVALELWRHRAFGLLLTDCHMPELDGFDLTRAIRTAEHVNKRRLPIVAITANALRGEADRCLQAGMDDYLAKPIQLAGLRQVLERWLGKPGEKIQHG